MTSRLRQIAVSGAAFGVGAYITTYLLTGDRNLVSTILSRNRTVPYCTHTSYLNNTLQTIPVLLNIVLDTYCLFIATMS